MTEGMWRDGLLITLAALTSVDRRRRGGQRREASACAGTVISSSYSMRSRPSSSPDRRFEERSIHSLQVCPAELLILFFFFCKLRLGRGVSRHEK